MASANTAWNIYRGQVEQFAETTCAESFRDLSADSLTTMEMRESEYQDALTEVRLLAKLARFLEEAATNQDRETSSPAIELERAKLLVLRRSRLS